MIFNVRLNPRSSKTGIDGVYVSPDGCKYLKISVNSPPVDGKANAALIAFLAKLLKTAKSRIRIVKGEQDRNKTIMIDDADAAILKELLDKNDSDDN